MSGSRVAIRYAKPLLELAQDQGVLEQVKEDMNLFDSLCKSNKDLVLMLKSPIIPHLRKLTILKAIFDGKVHELTSKIFEVIVRKNRESILPDIASVFLKLYNEVKGLVKATVTATFSLDKGTRKEFEQLIKKVTGKKAELEEIVDQDIIGGFKLKIEDRQIDETVSAKLKDLKLKFVSNASLY